ncbi:stemmadenine O-acetyltransferase-like [Humulus lupulus]|uniref:stemmadenine O-acetyltransferase-like n=1 Tax=Humulus lupulus TaxID=3486 RepID=UPI002B401EBF|nr:stemmadenine O-acetyltransferase-like [Humulus lupulus]
MAAKIMKVEIISKETIKPSSSTPSHLKTSKLSFLDQFIPPIHCRVVYFYPKSDHHDSTSATSELLKKSLSQTLARFYPLAGRIINNTTIDCNDEGAQYVEARCQGLLSTFLDQSPDLSQLQHFLPEMNQSPELGIWPQLAIQATFFDCGGMALDVCTAHKLIDAATVGMFIKSWAETSLNNCSDGDHQTADVVPSFDGASYFPPADPSFFRAPNVKPDEIECVTKRFVFDKTKVADLKAKVSSQGILSPSRAQVVTALIWKCAIAVSRSNSGGVVPTRFSLSQTMDIRKRTQPPLPDCLVGNGSTFIFAETSDQEPELKDLVSEIRRGIKDFTENKAKRLRGDDPSGAIFEDFIKFGQLIGCEHTHKLVVSSMCNFQLYEVAEFGWGKPIWVTVPVATGHGNFVRLMDTKEGGVEAFVTLSKEDMTLFECDSELLDFAYLSNLNSII